VENIWECSSKAIETSGAKNESTQARIYKTCKTITPFNSFFNLYISHINRPLYWNFRKNYEHGHFVLSKAISSITISSFLFFCFFFFSFFQNYLNNGTHELRMKTCSISPVIGIPQIQIPPHLFLAHHTFHNDEQCSTSFTAWVKALFCGFKACDMGSR